MIELDQSARDYLQRLLAQQGIPGLGVRMRAIDAGTPNGDCRLEYCEPDEVRADDLEIRCEGFSIYVDPASRPFLEGARLSFAATAAGGQMQIRAPRLRALPPPPEAPIAEHVAWLLAAEINPGLAAHGGRVSLERVTEDGVVELSFGGGCQGCSQVDRTLRQGVERRLLEQVPGIRAVRDLTDHARGERPYYRDGQRAGPGALD